MFDFEVMRDLVSTVPQDDARADLINSLWKEVERGQMKSRMREDRHNSLSYRPSAEQYRLETEVTQIAILSNSARELIYSGPGGTDASRAVLALLQKKVDALLLDDKQKAAEDRIVAIMDRQLYEAAVAFRLIRENLGIPRNGQPETPPK